MVYDEFFFRSHCSIYEIYPQSETPRLTQIAHLDLDNCPEVEDPYLLPETVIFWYFSEDNLNKIVFTVWDYRLNHSTSFSFDGIDADIEYSEVYPILPKALKFASNSFLGVGNRDKDRRHPPM